MKSAEEESYHPLDTTHTKHTLTHTETLCRLITDGEGKASTEPLEPLNLHDLQPAANANNPTTMNMAANANNSATTNTAPNANDHAK